MAEVVGLVSGLAGLVTFAAQITKLSYNLISDLKQASQTQKLYLQKVSGLTDVLFRADNAVAKAEALGLETLHPASLSESLIAECSQQLSRIHDDLAAGIKKCNWLFHEKELKKRIESLRAFHSVFLDYLSTHTLAITTETYREVGNLNRQQQQGKLLELLNPFVETSKPAPISSPGTGKWFLDSEQYRDWRDGDPSTLWCHGAPGSGKSVLASIVIHDLVKQDSSRSYVTYYFCDYAIRQQQDSLSILKSILRKLINQLEGELISPLIKIRDDAKGELDIKVISEMIVTICHLVPSTYLILDAPDELDAPKETIGLLQELATAGCRVFVTSRDTPDLRLSLSVAKTIALEAVRGDVLIFLECRFREEGHENLVSRGQNLLEMVVDKANGIFLLAKILVEKLLDMTTLAQMRKSMSKMPTTITEAFQSSVKRIEAQSLARRELAYRVIAWLTQSQRRLKADELVHGLAVENGSDEFDEDNIPDMQLVLRVCVGLVTREPTDNSIGMVHTTAHEFFHSRCPTGIRKDLAATCLTYLTVAPFNLGPCKTLDEMTERVNKRPFMLYSVKYWGDYIDNEEAEEDLSSLIDKLLSSRKLRLSSFQALNYHPEITERTLAAESLAIIPTDQEAIHLAAYWNLARTTDSLLKAGNDSSARDSQQWTPLHWACSKESLASTSYLIAAGADLDAQDSQGWTPLFWLAMKGNEAGVRMILSHRASHLVRDLNGWTALTWATSTRRRAVVQILLEHHEAFLTRLKKVPRPLLRELTVETARQYSNRRQADTAVEVAAGRGDTVLFDMLCTGNKTTFKEFWSVGHFDVPVSNLWRILNKSESMNGVESYLSDTVNEPGSTGWDFWRGQLLHGAIRDEKYMAAHVLIELGADVNCELGRTPLHAAAFRKDPRYAKLLLENSSDPSLRDLYGQTALHQAVVNGFTDTARELLRGQSDVNARVLKGRSRVSKRQRGIVESKTPLILACGLSRSSIGRKSSDPETIPSAMVSLLLSHNAAVNLEDTGGMSALHHAAKAGHYDVVQMLISAGADIHARDDENKTVLHYGIATADLRLVELLVDAGADVNAVDGQGKHLIHYLADDGIIGRGISTSGKDFGKILSLLIRTNDPTSLNVEWTRVEKRYNGPEPGGKVHQEVETPTSLALKSEKWTLFEVLHHLHATLPPAFDLQPFLPCAVRMLRLEAVKIILKYGVVPEGNVFFLGSFNLLQPISMYGFPWDQAAGSLDNFSLLLKELLHAGLDINKVQANGETILLVAAGSVNSSDLMQLLLDNGADPRQESEDGLDSFIISALRGNYDNLRTLLNWAVGSPLNEHWTNSIHVISPDDGLKCLIHALKHNNLLENYKNIKIPHGSRKCTLLWLSVNLGNEAMTKELLNYGSDPEVKDESGWRPIHVASYGGFIEIVRMLLLGGADVAAFTHKWISYHSMNRPSGYTAMSDYYTESDGWQGNALHLASMKGFPDIVELLISHGADVKAQVLGKIQRPGEGPTALHIALDNGTFYGWRAEPMGKDKLRIAEMLVAQGADVTTTADHIYLDGVLKFEHHQCLWDKLRAGITDCGARLPEGLGW